MLLVNFWALLLVMVALGITGQWQGFAVLNADPERLRAVLSFSVASAIGQVSRRRGYASP